MNRDPLWQAGTCDRIMTVLYAWSYNYQSGTISATGKYITKPGEMGHSPQEIEVPKRFACEVPWNYSDLQYLVKILETKVPDWPTTKDLRRCLPLWKNGRITRPQVEFRGIAVTLPPPVRVITMDYYDEDIVGIYRLLEAMRDGKTKEAKPDLSTVDLSSFS